MDRIRSNGQWRVGSYKGRGGVVADIAAMDPSLHSSMVFDYGMYQMDSMDSCGSVSSSTGIILQCAWDGFCGVWLAVVVLDEAPFMSGVCLAMVVVVEEVPFMSTLLGLKLRYYLLYYIL
eukprot:3770_1